MKKALLICDGSHFPTGAFMMAKNLHSLSPMLLTGVFLSSTQFTNLWFYPTGVSADFVTTMIAQDDEVVTKNIGLFTSLCKNYGMECSVHQHTEDLILDSVKKESRFADLIVMSSELFYANIEAHQPNSYTKTILHEAECPVLLVPEEAEQLTGLVLTYDGSDASVFAIKQFAYLFPELCNLDATLVFANNQGKEMPDKEYIEDFARRHFSKLSFVTLDISPKEYFATWAEHNKNSLLVSGSFGRSSISNAFKKSFITETIEDHEMPVFVSHK